MQLPWASAYGHWARIQSTADIFPYIMYNAVRDGRTRYLHKLWNGTVLPVNSKWWDTHYPPNGWRCRCSVIQMDQSTMDKMGLRHADEGELLSQENKGIDEGFAYNVGKSRDQYYADKYHDNKAIIKSLDYIKQKNLAAPIKLFSSNINDLKLADDITIDNAILEFYSQFAIYKDVAIDDNIEKWFLDNDGLLIKITDDLFRDAKGNIKLGKNDHPINLTPVYAQTIIAPDKTIIVQGNEQTNTYPRKYYTKKWQIQDGEFYSFAVAHKINSDWKLATSYIPGWTLKNSKKNLQEIIKKMGDPR